MIRYVKSSLSPWSTAGRSGLISFSRSSSPPTDSMPSRRNSALKPISSGSPANGAGSDSCASPTSCVCAETVSSPSAKRSRSGELRCAITDDAADDVEQLVARQRELVLERLGQELLVVRELPVDAARRQP